MTRQAQVEQIKPILQRGAGQFPDHIGALAAEYNAAPIAAWLYDAGLRLEAPTSPGDTSSGGSTSSAAPSPSPLEAGSRTFVNGHHIPELDRPLAEAEPSEKAIDAVAAVQFANAKKMIQADLPIDGGSMESYREHIRNQLRAAYRVDALDRRPTAPSTMKDDLEHYMAAAARFRDMRALVPPLREAIGKWGALMWSDGEASKSPADRWSDETSAAWARVDVLLQQLSGDNI